MRGLEVLAASGAPWIDAEVERWRDRPVDVLFLGTLSPRRSSALGRLASTLARYRCFIHAPTLAGGPLQGGKSEIGADESRWLARRAKIVLNLHRDDFPYLEWHRVMTMGVEQGAVVLSEPSLPSPGVEPGRHFVTATIDEMPAQLDRLLTTGDGEALAASSAQLAASELSGRFDLATELRALAFLHASRFAEGDLDA